MVAVLEIRSDRVPEQISGVGGGPGAALGTLHPRSLKHFSESLQALVRGRLWLQVLIGMVLGFAAGLTLGPSVGLVEPAKAQVIGSWLGIPGQLFLALIQMIVIPLVFASIIRGLAATENVDQLRRLGTRVVLYFIMTTSIAVSIGIGLALIVEPGSYIDAATIKVSDVALPDAASAGPPSFIDLPQKILAPLPTNPLSSMVENDMLRVVIFGIVVGIALVMIAPTQARPLLDLLGSLQQVCMTVVRWAMWLAPFAVFGLTAQLIAKIGLDALFGLAIYIATVIAGLLLMFCVYMMIIAFIAGKNPLAFVVGSREVFLLAFSTSSSAAVMPVTIRTAEDNNGVRPSVAQFIIPLGATINMDGTALYQGVAAIFLAQVFGVDISFGGLLLVVVTAVGASIGTPATPGVGIVILSMVLASVGVPAGGIALILGVDRILDMCRTTINVTGDLVAAQVMDHWVGGTHPARLEQAAHARHEEIRAETGQDTLILPH
jgi:Na+/H+-dicarboxylate symporter